MSSQNIPQAILSYLVERSLADGLLVSADEITTHLGISRPTINRHLSKMTVAGQVIRDGLGPATRYRVPPANEAAATATINIDATARASIAIPWSAEAQALRAQLQAAIGTRPPVTYRRDFVDNYVPNQSSLLPPDIADSLFARGKTQGHQPAGTYARKVLEQLLIDLSWYSSRLEGNRKSLLDTRALFAKGRSSEDDVDTSMLLNHKDAIEFMIGAVPEYGVTVPVVRNLQGLLMQGLLDDVNAVGAIRKTVVHIAESVYLPTQVPSLLEEMLGHIVEKARSVKNPLEAAFFLWVNIAYLQPFEDGNKRTSRLCANLPLLLANCAPLSFLDVETDDYALAMMGVYERLDVTLATELFGWTYQRSIQKYSVIRDAMGAPDPFRAKYREHLSEAILQVVHFRVTFAEAVAALSLPEADQAPFQTLLRDELQRIEPFNCARYRLSIRKTEEWIRDQRPM
jgi:Fic family protein